MLAGSFGTARSAKRTPRISRPLTEDLAWGLGTGTHAKLGVSFFLDQPGSAKETRSRLAVRVRGSPGVELDVEYVFV